MVHWIQSLVRRVLQERAVATRRHRRALGRRQLHVEQLEDRTVPSGVMANYSVMQDWGSGFQAQISLVNQQTASIPNWNLSFDYAASISSVWDGTVISHTGNHYVIGNAGWNSNIAGGNMVSFGFVAGPSSSTAAPTHFLLNGMPLDGTPAPLPTVSVSDTTLTEPTAGSANANFTVTLSAASTTAVTVKYATTDGSARTGADYTAKSGIITFASGQTQQTISVPVLADSTPESDESFTITLSAPSGATLSRGQAIALIHNAVPPAPTPPPSTGVAQFQATSDWGSGFSGQITVKNTGTSALNNWNLAFDFAGQITSVWNGSIVSHTGNYFVMQGASWNTSLAAGASTSFGFNGSPGGGTVSPTNYVLTGAAVTPPSGGGSTTTTPFTAVSDMAWTTVGVPTIVNVLANDTGSGLTVTGNTQGLHGAVVRNADGTLTYSPVAGYVGSDSFTYTAKNAAGTTANANVAVTVANSAVSTWPAHVFAPYIDMTLYPTPDLVNIAQTQGVKFFSLAFVVADPNKQPAWGGYASYGVNGSAYDQQMRTAIAGLRALGGDVSVSFGGANGQELAQAITNVSSLTAAYQSVINAYQLTHLDFDIEGGAAADKASIDRRSQALAALQQQAAASGKPLVISFTLPVLPTGLTPDGVYVLQSALRYGVKINIVNIMAMDYGDSAAPSPQEQMGTYAIQAANSLFSQLQGLYGSNLSTTQVWGMVGITPMIGRNDVTTEVFDQAAARQLLAFAQQKGIGELSMWSIARDHQDPAGALNYSTYLSSSIVQSPFEFSHIFGAFNS